MANKNKRSAPENGTAPESKADLSALSGKSPDGMVEKDVYAERSASEKSETEKHIATAEEKNLLFMVKESYKAIRTNLILSLPGRGCKKIVITSSVSGEGKTTTTANVATSLAQTDKKVLLIDCDLRKPSIYKTLSLHNAPGLTNVLTGLSTLEEAINDTVFPNLQVLCAGISVPNPSELLACDATVELLESLENKYDYILFDTPPINVVSDALPLIQISDGAVLVVRQNYSVFPEVTRAVHSIQFINGKILGFVFNGLDHDKYGKYGSYGKYGKYGKYYSSKYRYMNASKQSNDMPVR